MSQDDATRPVPHEPATERLGTAPDPADPGRPPGTRRMTWLWVAIGVLAIAVLVLLALLILRPAATPAADTTATPTPSESPSSTPPAETSPEATTEPAPPSAPVFTSFSAEPTTADCSGGAASVPLVFSWSSEGATEAWIGVGTTDAQAAPYEAVPTSASGYANLAFQCSEESQVYTVTISGPTGVTHNSVTIVRG
ncbi:hypothetical protein [Agromyces sp. ZXT2-6]|uniref:hypothetical protein n=1 Tax=Agromyces sp. ZXT2-6 TaxID=3461153 RepID=UPI0040551037